MSRPAARHVDAATDVSVPACWAFSLPCAEAARQRAEEERRRQEAERRLAELQSELERLKSPGE